MMDTLKQDISQMQVDKESSGRELAATFTNNWMKEEAYNAKFANCPKALAAPDLNRDLKQTNPGDGLVYINDQSLVQTDCNTWKQSSESSNTITAGTAPPPLRLGDFKAKGKGKGKPSTAAVAPAARRALAAIRTLGPYNANEKAKLKPVLKKLGDAIQKSAPLNVRMQACPDLQSHPDMQKFSQARAGAELLIAQSTPFMADGSEDQPDFMEADLRKKLNAFQQDLSSSLAVLKPALLSYEAAKKQRDKMAEREARKAEHSSFSRTG